MSATAEKACSTCQGGGVMQLGGMLHKCPLCEGSGTAFDPGRQYTYDLAPIVLAGGASLTYLSLQILNYRFRWAFAMATYDFAFTSQVLDSRDQRPFSNQQVHNLNLWGTAQHPLPLLTPFVFEKNSQIQVNITDLGGGAGTALFTNGSANVVGATGTPFVTTPSGQPGSWIGKPLVVGGVTYTIVTVPDTTHLTISPVFAAGTATLAYAVNNNIRLAFQGVELNN